MTEGEEDGLLEGLGDGDGLGEGVTEGDGVADEAGMMNREIEYAGTVAFRVEPVSATSVCLFIFVVSDWA